MNRSPLRLVLVPSLLAAALVLGSAGGGKGCAAGREGSIEPRELAVAPPSLNQLLDLEWRLLSLEGKPAVPPADTGGILEGRPTIVFIGGGAGPMGPGTMVQVSGFSGVNRFNGSTEMADLREGRMRVSRLGITRMAGPPDQMELERVFTGVLEQARRWGVTHDGTRLSLRRATGEEVARFERIGQVEQGNPAAPLSGTGPRADQPGAAGAGTSERPDTDGSRTSGVGKLSERPVVTMKGAPVKLEGRTGSRGGVRIGGIAWPFTAVANDLSEKSLSDYKGKVVILCTVPSLETPVCDAEVRRFNERAAALGEGFIVLVVSMDLPFTQKRWCGSAGIDPARVQTLSDSKRREVGDRYALRIAEHGILCRSVTIIDAGGVVRYQQIVPEVASEPDYDAAITAAQSAAQKSSKPASAE